MARGNIRTRQGGCGQVGHGARTDTTSCAARHEQLAAYLAAHHESLVALLPPDTKCTDLFGEVDAKRPIVGFFKPTEDAAIGRELLRFTQMIELWLVEEKRKGKEKEKRDKANAVASACRAQGEQVGKEAAA
eukprot:119321-Prymnesium_polylepis.1